MRNRKKESEAAFAARQARRFKARQSAEAKMISSLHRRGWSPVTVPIPVGVENPVVSTVFVENGAWINYVTGEVGQTVYEACKLQRNIEKREAEYRKTELEQYLRGADWRWSEQAQQWYRLHWEKVVALGESPYYFANLKNAVRQQMKLDAKKRAA